MLSHSSSKHISIIILVDYKVAVFIFVEKAWSKFIELKAAATLPVVRFGDTALFSFDNFLHAHSTMGICVVAEFYTYPLPTHFVCNSSCGSATEKAIKNNISRIRS